MKCLSLLRPQGKKLICLKIQFNFILDMSLTLQISTKMEQLNILGYRINLIISAHFVTDS